MLPPFPEGTITSFAPKTPHFFLSNFFSHSISYEGLTYPTAEHAYQAAKSPDPDTRMSILRVGSAGQAKKLGGTIKCREDWPTVKYNIMRDILDLKFAPGSPLEKRLWDTSDVYLIEGNYWHDTVWGQCFCHRHAWEGTNYLGQLLMSVRASIQGGQYASQQSGTGIEYPW